MRCDEPMLARSPPASEGRDREADVPILDEPHACHVAPSALTRPRQRRRVVRWQSDQRAGRVYSNSFLRVCEMSVRPVPCLLLLSLLHSRSSVAQSGTGNNFVLLLGRDTSWVEHVEHQANRLRIDIVNSIDAGDLDIERVILSIGAARRVDSVEYFDVDGADTLLSTAAFRGLRVAFSTTVMNGMPHAQVMTPVKALPGISGMRSLGLLELSIRSSNLRQGETKSLLFAQVSGWTDTVRYSLARSGDTVTVADRKGKPLLRVTVRRDGSIVGGTFLPCGAVIHRSTFTPMLRSIKQDGWVPPAPGGHNLIAEISDSGRSLQSDGRGVYHNPGQGGVATISSAIVVCSDRRTCTTLPESLPATPSARAMSINLSQPVAGSGATNLGVVTSTAANFGAFWAQDSSRHRWFDCTEHPYIRSLRDLPTDSTVQSDRIELRFFLGSVQHILQFGPWTAGQYQTKQGPYDGRGTTPGTITRTSGETWTIRSSERSVGRLWDNRDPAHPIDLGLYAFPFDVHVRYPPIPPKP